MSHNTLCTCDLIASASGFLKYVVANNIVIYLFDNHTTAGLRFYAVGAFDVTATVEQAESWSLGHDLDADTCSAAAILAVCDEQYDEHARQLIDATQRGLEVACGIRVYRRIMNRNVTEAGQWIDVDSGESGQTYPYTDSVVVAKAVYSGTVIYPRRSDLPAEAINPPPFN